MKISRFQKNILLKFVANLTLIILMAAFQTSCAIMHKDATVKKGWRVDVVGGVTFPYAEVDDQSFSSLLVAQLDLTHGWVDDDGGPSYSLGFVIPHQFMSASLQGYIQLPQNDILDYGFGADLGAYQSFFLVMSRKLSESISLYTSHKYMVYPFGTPFYQGYHSSIGVEMVWESGLILSTGYNHVFGTESIVRSTSEKNYWAPSNAGFIFASLGYLLGGSEHLEARMNEKVTEKKKEIPVKVDDAVLRGTYTNNANILHTREEFLFDFMCLYPPQGIVASRVIMSPGHAKRFLSALSENVRRFEEKFGAIPEARAEEPPNGYLN